ncbi:hypothetical protein D3C76_1404220 [compost metagenome]
MISTGWPHYAKTASHPIARIPERIFATRSGAIRGRHISPVRIAHRHPYHGHHDYSDIPRDHPGRLWVSYVPGHYILLQSIVLFVPFSYCYFFKCVKPMTKP